MPIPAPEKSKLPLPVTLPPPFDMPLRLESTSFEPPNAPRMLTDVSDMPVTGLDRRASSAMTDTRMMGLARVPGADRKHVVWGKSVAVRVRLGVGRLIKNDIRQKRN